MSAQRAGQIEAFSPAPRRKLIVARGCGAWWGVDPGTQRCAIGVVTADGVRSSHVCSFPTLEGGERLAYIYEAVRSLADVICQGQYTFPGVVVVEQPSGKQANPALSYAVGATMAGVWKGIQAPSTHGVRVETVSSSAWKKSACGRGDIYKPKPASGVPYGVLTWARSLGYAGTSWDEADAWGIAEYARRTIALEQR